MKGERNKNMYHQIQRLAELTENLIRQGKIQRAKRCMEIAEKLYSQGTTEIRNAISNLYVASVSTFMLMHHCSIRNLLPAALQQEYYKQADASGI